MMLYSFIQQSFAINDFDCVQCMGINVQRGSTSQTAGVCYFNSLSTQESQIFNQNRFSILRLKFIKLRVPWKHKQEVNHRYTARCSHTRTLQCRYQTFLREFSWYVYNAIEGSELYCYNTEGDRNSIVSQASCVILTTDVPLVVHTLEHYNVVIKISFVNSHVRASHSNYPPPRSHLNDITKQECAPANMTPLIRRHCSIGQLYLLL